MNVNGDGDDVWPWTSAGQRNRYDCSKLDQWEMVFEHMDAKGLMLHVVTQETENDQLLDGGSLGNNRKLYYRELLARFGHHLAITWNLGEENSNSASQLQAFYRFFQNHDAYAHPIVVHTFPNQKNTVFNGQLGRDSLHGASLQMSSMSYTHSETQQWISASASNGTPWIVSLDEIGPPGTGVKPDSSDLNHDSVRQHALWGNLMAGGGGCEWYFGYSFPHDDLDCEDWRSRSRMWDLTAYALDFFEQIPFHEMVSADGLVSGSSNWCLAKGGEVYACYLPNGGTANLNLGSHTGVFDVFWFNPRSGGALQQGSIQQITGPGNRSLGQPPSSSNKDWAVLVRGRGNLKPIIHGTSISPDPYVQPGGSMTFVADVTDPNGANDILSVHVILIAPGVSFVGTAHLPASTGSNYALTIPVTKPAPTGRWEAVFVAFDQSGARTFSGSHFFDVQ